MVGAQGGQGLGLGAGAGGGDRGRAGPVGQLDGRDAHAGRGGGDDDEVARPGLAELEDAHGGHVLHPDRGAVFERHLVGHRDQGVGGHDRLLAIDAIIALLEVGDDRDPLVWRKALDPWTSGHDHARGFIADLGRQAGRLDIAALAEQDFGAVQPDRLDPHQDFAGTRRAELHIVDHQGLGAARLVYAHDLGHGFYPHRLRCS